MQTIAAFFDIDGTLYREGLITEVFKKLIKSELIESEKWYKEVRPKYQKWDRRVGTYDDYLLKIANIYIDAIKGLHTSQIEFIAEKVVSQKGDRVYRYTRDKIKWHKSQGHLVLAISGSPEELVREMSKKHQFDDFKATKYLLENNIYTGEYFPMWDSVNKRKSINYFSKKYNINLNKSYAYGDTSGDFSMFEMVGNPICINATRELLDKVLENKLLREKVKIIVERKDVIYNLNAKELHIDN